MDSSADTLSSDPLTNSQLSHLAKIKDIVAGITHSGDEGAFTTSEINNLAEITSIVARLEHGARRCRLVRRAGTTVLCFLIPASFFDLFSRLQSAPLAVTTNLAPRTRSSTLVRRATSPPTRKQEVFTNLFLNSSSTLIHLNLNESESTARQAWVGGRGRRTCAKAQEDRRCRHGELGYSARIVIAHKFTCL
jgi:hypothetical protein